MRFLRSEELSVDAVLATNGMVIVAGEGEVRGEAAAALLFADFAVLHRDAMLFVEEAEGWGAAVWRIGRRALLLPRPMDASAARAAGLVDDLYDGTFDEWREKWMRHRSGLALDTAAALIRMRGGDVLERAAFSWLFACGEPQEGLAAFLGKRCAF